jgi:tetratricopeptide (TPR) repeat protein
MRPVRIAASFSVASTLLVAPAWGQEQGAAAAAQVAPDVATVPPTEAQRALISDRLARSLAARARIVLQREIVFLGVLNNSKKLMQMALALEPENPHIWRLAVALAAVLEDGDPDAAVLLSQGLAKLNRLEPDDEVLRLRRVLDTVNQRQTVEARVDALQAMLTEKAIDTLGADAAARVAFDLALLLRRTGDSAGFERNLILALDLDPNFPEAAELAAGYFRVNAPTVVDEVAAMRAAMLANPMNEAVAVGFAHLCLEHGAYAAAGNVLEVQSRLQRERGPSEDYDSLLADYLVALWGAGRPDIGFAVAARRQEELDRVLFAEIERQGMSMTSEERAQAHLPSMPGMATALAAMSSGVGAPTAKVAVSNVAFAFDTLLEQMSKRNGDRAVMAATALESAFAQLWLDGSIDKAQAMISKALEFEPLSDAARARFDGWIALRRDDHARAKELLQPLAQSDLSAKLGLAVAHDETGDQKGAATLYLEVARATPDTALGLWARARLYKLLGSTPLIMPDAAAVEEAGAMPPGFAKLLRDASLSMLLRVVPRQVEARPWDPLLFDIELINRSDWPLAIGPEGPLKDSMTVSASVNVPGEMPRTPQVVLVPIDRQFTLAPGEALRIPVDVSLTDASAALREDALSGAFVSLHAIVNWRTTLTGFEPSPLGLEVESQVVHLSGERVSKEWVERSLAQLRDTSAVPDPELIALLSHVLVRKAMLPGQVSADVVAALDGAGDVLADAARRLWPEARAWLVFACPKGKRIEAGREAQDLLDVVAAGGVETGAAVPELEALDKVLRDDESPVVRISWLAVRVRRPEDPELVRSLESASPDVKAYAEECKQWLIEARDERAKQLNIKQ